MTLAQLTKRKDYWQDRLNLREWSIGVRWATASEGKKALGLCTWSAEELTAVIAIRRGANDREATLVHELLHIVLQGHANYEEYDIHAERAINRIAAALTKL